MAEAGALTEPSGSTVQVALAHDYLNQRGGAERLVLALSNIWPNAAIYTSLYRASSTFSEFQSRQIVTSFLTHVPVNKRFRSLFLLYPSAFRSFRNVSADVVISSSSGFAHYIRPRPETVHIVYCHTPARWLYGDYLPSRSGHVSRDALPHPLLARLIMQDQAAAARADAYLVNSENTRARVEEVYQREATVIYPPVDTKAFSASPRGERLLVISRLLPYKNVDLMIRAATRAHLPLDVVGTGPQFDQLKSMAGPTVRLLGSVPDPELRELLQNCRAVCLAAREDFGIVPVEAMAAGKPVVAYGKGGVLETVVPGVTGTFYYERTESAFLEAVAAADELSTDCRVIAKHAERFSIDAFATAMRSVVDAANRRCLDRP